MDYLDNDYIEDENYNKQLYKKFKDNLLERYGYTVEDISSWTHAGWFPYGITQNIMNSWVGNRLAKFNSEVSRGIQKWKNVMGDIPMPLEYGEKHCVCDVEIIWNHIIVDDPSKDEFEMLIIGRECIKGFGNINIGCKCSICGTKINNSKSGKCKKCRKIRFCTREGCKNQIVKYKKGTFCSDKCEFPEHYCKCGSLKKIYKGEFMPECYPCYKKNNPHKIKKY